MTEQEIINQEKIYPQDIWCGKMSKEHYPQTMEKTLESSSKKQRKSQMNLPLFLDLRKKKDGQNQDVSWEKGIPWLGESIMPNIGECLKEEDGFVYLWTLTGTPLENYYLILNIGEKPMIPNPTKLIDVLESNPDPKYNLSPKACAGILGRAERRGKKLPEILEVALRNQAKLLNEDLTNNSKEDCCVGVDLYNQSVTGDISKTLNSISSDADHVPCVIKNNVKCFGIGSYDSGGMKSSNPNSGIYEADTSRTLDLQGGNPACNQGGIAIVFTQNQENITYGIDQQGGKGQANYTENVSPTLASDSHGTPHAVCYRGDAITNPINGSNPNLDDPCHTLINDSRNYVVTNKTNYGERVNILNPFDSQGNQIADSNGIYPTLRGCGGAGYQQGYCLTKEQIPIQNTAGSLCASGYDKLGTQEAMNGMYVVQKENLLSANRYIVRRLTPLECERLQGFPTVRKVRFTEMTKDEYIAWNINEGNIVVDTEYGKVFATRGPGGIKLDEPKELTGSIVNGYRVVSIRNGETKIQCRVHRIVWIAEHGIIPDGYVIDHINNNKQDNRLCNLQLLTPKENSTKARKDELYKIHEEAGQAKITDEVHDFIQYVYGNTDLSIRQLSEIFGISKSRVHQIIHDEAWTNIGEWIDSKGKKHKDADSPRYKALGNSIALPFWKHLLDKISAMYDNKGTLGSLFSGIGGFDICWEQTNGKGSCVWQSDIEEFCLAVCKKHFIEE